MSPIGDLARQDEYLPDVGEPLVPSGPQFSPGLPAVNRMADILTTRPARDEASPVEYRTASPLVNITKQDIEDATNAAQAFSGGGLGIKAYHSSPHDFDKFDLSKIGTGEGAQVYGHGLYFAENPAVSGQGGEYWKQFARRFQGDEYPPELVNAVQILESTGGDRAAALDKIKQALGNVSPTAYSRAHMERVRDLLASDKPVGPRTYEVDINADPAHFLDWDKGLLSQSPKVQQALEPFSPPLGRTIGQADNPAGREIYQGSYQLPRQPSAASRALNEAGIPGIKYLDQGSRMHASDITNAEKTIENLKARGQTHMLDAWQEELARLKKSGPSSNYVVFDPNRIDILRKYGIAGAAPLGMGALAAQDNYQPQE